MKLINEQHKDYEMKKLILALVAIIGGGASIACFADSATMAAGHQSHHKSQPSKLDEHNLQHAKAAEAAHLHDHNNNEADAKKHAAEHNGSHALAHHHDHGDEMKGAADAEAHENDHLTH